MQMNVKKNFIMILCFAMMMTLCAISVCAETTVDVKQIDVDANFSRIEFTTTIDEVSSSGVTIAANTPFSFTFTPQKTGTYAMWYMRPQGFQTAETSNTVAFTVADENGAVYDVPAYKAVYHSQMSGVDPVLERINGVAGASPRNMQLTAGVAYTVTITPTADLAPLSFVDFRCLNLPINGKTAISPADITNTGITDNVMIVRIPASFEGADQALIDPEYTLVGNYASEELTLKDTKYRSMHPGTSWMEYTLDVETPGVYTITTYTGTYGFSGTKIIENHFYLDGVLLTSFSDEITPEGQKYFKTTPQFYLSEGTHTLRISTEGSAQGAYIGAIKFTPQDNHDNMIVADVSGTSGPALVGAPFFAGENGAVNENGTWVLDTDASVTLKFKSEAERTLELFAKNVEVPEGAAISYVLDSDAPVETSLVKNGTIFKDKTIAPGEHTLTITAKTDGIKISLLSFREKLMQNFSVTDIAPVGDTNIDLFSFASSFGDVSVINEGQSLSFGNGSEISYTINIQKDGIYTVYMNSLSAQQAFDIYVDDGAEPLTSPMYQYIDSNGTNASGQKLYDNTNVAYNNTLDKELILYGVQLDAGEHTFTLKFKNGYKSNNNLMEPVAITDEENFMSTINKLWIARVDPEVNDTDEVIIRAWETTAGGPASSGWSYVNQHNQGGEQIIDGKSCRSTVFMNGLKYTYTFNAASDGYYDFSAYIKDHAPSETVPDAYYTLSVDGGEAVNIPVPFSGGSDFLKTTHKGIYLTAGAHTFTIVANPANLPGVNRLYSISLAKSGISSVSIDAGESKAAVDAYFDAPCSGTAFIALYSEENQLIGLYKETISDAEMVAAKISYTGTPVKAKVFVWSDTENVIPVIDDLVFTNTDEHWIVK